MERKIAVCLKCGHKWFTKWTPDKQSPQWQCPKCWGYSVTFEEEYEKDLQHLRKLIAPEEAEKFIELYRYALEHSYIWNTKTREAKFLRLLEDLAKSYSRKSLGDEQ